MCCLFSLGYQCVVKSILERGRSHQEFERGKRWNAGWTYLWAQQRTGTDCVSFFLISHSEIDSFCSFVTQSERPAICLFAASPRFSLSNLESRLTLEMKEEDVIARRRKAGPVHYTLDALVIGASLILVDRSRRHVKRS